MALSSGYSAQGVNTTVGFYSADAISSVKDLLLSEVDSLKSENEINVPRRRRESIDKPGAKASNDFDDILRIFTTLDERELLDNIARFVSVSPDAMPSSQIAVGDFLIVLSKLCNLEEQYQQLKTEIGSNRCKCIARQSAILTDRRMESLPGRNVTINNCDVVTISRRQTPVTRRGCPIHALSLLM